MKENVMDRLSLSQSGSDSECFIIPHSTRKMILGQGYSSNQDHQERNRLQLHEQDLQSTRCRNKTSDLPSLTCFTCNLVCHQTI
jgi:hypothetical protein